MAKRIMIMGCGRVGGALSQLLAGQGNQVTIIDINADNFRRLRYTPNLRPLVADGNSVDDLRNAGIEQTDVFMAVSAQDTINVLAAQTAQVTFQVPIVVCRVNDPVRQDIYEQLGLRTVSTTELTAKLVLEAMER
jgi:trk system potassium uptake protein TrkA